LGLLAFAMVPTKELRLQPQKPLYFYVVQLLSAQVSAGGAAAAGCMRAELPHSIADYFCRGMRAMDGVATGGWATHRQ
jgi:hypothetical protein